MKGPVKNVPEYVFYENMKNIRCCPSLRQVFLARKPQDKNGTTA